MVDRGRRHRRGSLTACGRVASAENVITGLAHTGVCVPDCEAAVAFYRDVLGLRVLSPPYVMDGDAIRDDMGELVADPADEGRDRRASTTTATACSR